jgi:phenylalanyl-tRNA synthetase alpha chain
MKTLESRVDALREKFEESLAKVKDARALEDLRNEFLSRKRGHITLLFDELKRLSPEKKRSAGKIVNELKAHVQEKLNVQLKGHISAKASVKGTLKSPEPADLTLPGEILAWGAPHPVTLFQEEIERIFEAMGFSIAEGPEIETDYYNFEALPPGTIGILFTSERIFSCGRTLRRCRFG